MHLPPGPVVITLVPSSLLTLGFINNFPQSIPQRGLGGETQTAAEARCKKMEIISFILIKELITSVKFQFGRGEGEDYSPPSKPPMKEGLILSLTPLSSLRFAALPPTR